jgi:hypothetical protein
MEDFLKAEKILILGIRPWLTRKLYASIKKVVTSRQEFDILARL